MRVRYVSGDRFGYWRQTAWLLNVAICGRK